MVRQFQFTILFIIPNKQKPEFFKEKADLFLKQIVLKSFDGSFSQAVCVTNSSILLSKPKHNQNKPL